MEEKAYGKLQWKIVATTLSFSLVPLVALGISMYHQFSVSYTAKIMESLRTLAENRRNALDLFLDERISQLNTLAYTHTCYHNQQPPCGVCPACLLRARGFAEAGIPDPLVERFTDIPR
ncbi:MAG: hypothetical protein HGB17_14675 [Syntrophobacteraceae bacterium]|nr:hypothetical protein [Syntrophobacteraceae bacterium]